MPIPLVEVSEKDAIRLIKNRVQAIDEVATLRSVTMGFTRKKPIIQLHVWLKGDPGYEQIHKVCSMIEMSVRHVVPNARVVTRSETGGDDLDSIRSVVKKIAEAEPGSRGAQSVHMRILKEGVGVDFVLEVSTLLDVTQASNLEIQIAKKLKAAEPRISDVVIHRQTVAEMVSSEKDGYGTEVKWFIEHVAHRFPEIIQLRIDTIRVMGDDMSVTLRCNVARTANSGNVVEMTGRLGREIMDGYPAIKRVDFEETGGMSS